MFDQDELVDEFDLEDEEVNEALDKEETEDAPEPKHSEPAVKMHISKDEWIAQGRDPELWVPPEVFKERTQRINETNKLRQENAKLKAEREADARRLTNVAFLQQQQITRMKAELEQRRDDAIDVGDRNAVKALDRQIRDLDTEESLIKEPVVQSNIPPEVQEWNEENAWLTSDHPLKGLANDVFVKAMNEGKTIAGALRVVDRELAKHKDEPAPKKVATKSIVDSPSRGSVAKSDSVSLRFEDCTREEKEMFNEFYKPSGATLKEFLKDVSLARKGN
jgi:hypothetical protein